MLDVVVRAGPERAAVCAYDLRDPHVLDEVRKGTAEVTQGKAYSLCGGLRGNRDRRSVRAYELGIDSIFSDSALYY